jgi:hypothetical protein
MDVFSIHQEKQVGKKLGIFLGVFGCGDMNINNNKLVHDA